MKKALPYGIILLCIVAGIIFFYRGCESKRGPDHSADVKTVDSIVQRAKSDSATAKKIVDHLANELASLRFSNDSLISVQQQSKQLVNKAGGQILGLITRIDSLKQKNDVLGQLAGCDSLKELYEGAAKIVGGYEYLSDSLIDKLKSERGLADSTKNYLWSMFSQSNQQLFAIGLKYDALYADYKKINIKPKKWAIGPSIGAFITNKGVGYGAGITITYSIIKF